MIVSRLAIGLRISFETTKQFLIFVRIHGHGIAAMH